MIVGYYKNYLYTTYKVSSEKKKKINEESQYMVSHPETSSDSPIGSDQYRGRDSIDYKGTFSPASSKDSFRTIMALVAHFDLELHQMDVKTAFLNGDIDETIYMVQPKKFVLGDTKKMVRKLKKEFSHLSKYASEVVLTKAFRCR